MSELPTSRTASQKVPIPCKNVVVVGTASREEIPHAVPTGGVTAIALAVADQANGVGWLINAAKVTGSAAIQTETAALRSTRSTTRRLRVLKISAKTVDVTAIEDKRLWFVPCVDAVIRMFSCTSLLKGRGESQVVYRGHIE